MPRLTNAIAHHAKPKEKTYDVADESLPGFCLRVTPAGCRSWALRYRTADGKSRRMSLGRVEDVGVEDARRRAKQELGTVASGEDPRGERQRHRDATTVAELCEWYLTTYAVTVGKTKHSLATDRSYVRCHLSADGRLARMKIVDVARDDIEQLKVAMAQKPGAFRKVLAILKVMFRRAEEIGARPTGTNPCVGVKAARPRSIERFLTPAERVRLERACDDVLAIGPKLRGHLSSGAVDAVRFLSMTGMRAGEVVDILRWGHVDWQHQQLRLPRSKTGAKQVHLSDVALEFLRDRHRRQPDDGRVFEGEKGGKVSIGRSWRVIRNLAKLSDVRLHDLRHAFASDAIMAGVSLPKVSKLLGHRQFSTTQRYAHIADDVLRDAANATAGRMAGETSARTGRRGA